MCPMLIRILLGGFVQILANWWTGNLRSIKDQFKLLGKYCVSYYALGDRWTLLIQRSCN